MSIHRSNFDYIFKVDKIAKNLEDERDEKKHKKRVLYKGRSWKETEENLPVQPKEDTKEKKRDVSDSSLLYIDHYLLEKAKSRFAHLTTLEEKCAQLCFYQTSAAYDENDYNEMRLLILNEEVGGILFIDGIKDRESYLIQQLQKIAKTPLLFVNGFSFGYKKISELWAGKPLPNAQLLGSQWIHFLKQSEIHIQMDYSTHLDHEKFFNDSERQSIRKGMRENKGVVGRLVSSSKSGGTHSAPTSIFPQGLFVNSLKTDLITEVPGLKSLEFSLFNIHSMECPWDYLRDAFVLNRKEDIKKIIQKLVDLVRSGKISEDELDKKVLRILLFKALLIK